MLIQLSDLYAAVLKAASIENLSVPAWCNKNGIGVQSFRNLVNQPPHSQGKLITYIKVCDALKGGVYIE